MKDLAYWKAKKAFPREEKFLRNRKFIEDLTHVDQIWEYLKIKSSQVLAVNDLRGNNKEKLTYGELADYITKVSKAFYALGLRKNDVVTLISENTPRWLIVDQAIMRLGAIDAVRGCNAPSIELDYIIKHSDSVGLVIQSRETWLKLSNKKELKELFKFIVCLEGENNEDLINWNDFVKLGEGISTVKYKSEINKSKLTDIATILYTSGTTGNPKGVPLTHANFLHQIINLACIADPKPGTRVLSVLPIWHSYERSAEYFFFSCGCSQFYTSPKFLKEDIKTVEPVVMATVPRLWEAIHDGFFQVLKKMPPLKQSFIRFLIKNSGNYKKDLRRVNNLEIEQSPSIFKLKSLFSVITRFPIHKLSTLFLWTKILRQLCGDKLKFPINGGGALPVHVDLFFESLGINVLVGYGLTETSPVLSCRRTWSNLRGSSGQPLPYTEVQIVDDSKRKILRFREIGKILVRGPQVMNGYLNNESATSKVLSKNGWFDTGDLGFMLPNGCLVITGREKDTIVLSNGENIEPNPLEIEILSSEYINQVQLCGQDKKNLSALVVPNFELVYKKFLDKDLNSINLNQKIRNFYKSHINDLLRNRIGSRFEEQIIDCVFVDQFSLENGLLTQTLKQKRKEIEKLYSLQIEEMYKKQIKKENMI